MELKRNKPVLSVIIPIYKVENYIERCARSLFEQTLKNIQYIFIDDCSPDNSIEILKKVINEYPDRKSHCEIYTMPSNSGQAEVRRHGINIARAKYIAHCDSDDWIEPDMYEKMLDYAISGDYDVVWCDFYISDGINQSISYQKSDNDKISIIKKFFKGELMASVWNRIYKRNLHNADFIYPQANMTEDFVINTQLILNSSKIGYIPLPLYNYFYNPDSIVRKNSKDKHIKNFNETKINTDLVLNILKAYDLQGSMRDEIVYKKMFCKELLVPLLKEDIYKKLWFNTYSEINKKILTNPFVNTKTKIRFILLKFGIYSLFRNR